MKKVVLVTGASKGIGKATAIEFAKHDYNIVINYYSDNAKAEEVKKYIIENYDVDVMLCKADVSKEDEVKNMVNEVINHFGKIDVLVNNAGIAIDTTFEDKTVENFRRTLDVNLIGQFICARAVSKYMLKEGSGSIINISSNTGFEQYYPYGLDYDASKAGVISLTHNLAVEFAPTIRVNSVAPGWVNTEMNKELDEEFVKEECEKIFLGRFAEPSEIAKVVVFLASDDASYINGEIIRLDGGNYQA